MHTKAGTLKSPPYLQGQKKADCVKSYRLADIITTQFTPSLARQSANGKAQGDRHMEREINQWMRLSQGMKEACEEAKSNGSKSFKIFKGNVGSIIEVFFDIDITQPLNKAGTLVNKSLEDVNNAALTYEKIEVPEVTNAFYLALDKNYTRIFVYFSRGFDMVYGAEIGKWVLDIRHSEYKNWLLANPHLCWAA